MATMPISNLIGGNLATLGQIPVQAEIAPNLVPKVNNGNGKISPSLERIKLPSRINVRSVMASPPVTTLTTSHTIATPTLWASVTNSGTQNRLGGTSFTYSRAGAPVIFGASFPDNQCVKFTNVNYGGGTLQSNGYQISFFHDGAELEIAVKGSTGYINVKIDGEYVSLTPTTVPGTGSIYYYYIPFGSTKMRRIDVQIYNVPFAGVYTGPTDTITAAPIRGPRTIVMGDSFTEGTGSSSSTIGAWVYSFADAMGWDDVWPSGVGGTGYITAPSPKVKFRDRVSTDITPFSPEVVVIAGGINDSAQTPAAVLAEATALYRAILDAVPDVTLVVCSPFWRNGAETLLANFIGVRDAIKNAALAVGAHFLDVLEQPLPDGYTPITSALASTAAASATSLSTTTPLAVRSTYAFPDGTRFQVKSVSGTGPFTVTTGAISVGQASGTVITQVGDVFWTGFGKVGSTTGYGNSDLYVSSDGTHPTDAGHIALGQCVAARFMDTFAPN